MKKLVLLLALLSSVAFAQTNPGNVELSVAATGGSFSQSSTYDGETNDGDTQKYFILAMRSGFFLSKGLQLEPEFLMTAAEGDKPVFSIAGNIAYNIDIQQSNVKPFILAGYGIGNSIPLFNVLLGKTTPDFDVKNFNIGGGIKIFVSKSAAIRVEYRYQKFSFETEYFDWFGDTTSKIENSITMSKIMFGISIFI